MALEFEIAGKGEQRGLIKTEPNLQTFEVYIPHDMRVKYDQIFKMAATLEFDQKRKFNAEGNTNKVPMIQKAIPAGVDIRTLEKRRTALNI